MKFLLVLKSFNGVSSQFKGCLRCNGSFKDISRVFQGSLKGVSGKFEGCFNKSVSRKFQGNFKDSFSDKVGHQWTL